TCDVTPDGQLWVGTSTQGLYALSPSKLAIVRSGDRAQGADFIGALVAESPSRLLAGTQGRGFLRMADGRAEAVDAGSSLRPNTFVNCMLRLEDGTVLAGTSGGLVRFRNGAVEPWPGANPVPLDVWELCEDGDGVWVGLGNGGLRRMEKGRVSEVDFGSSAVPVKGMAMGKDGALWVGTRGNGLFRRSGNSWTRFGRAEGLASEVIRVIHVTDDGRVWVGTAGGGLSVL